MSIKRRIASAAGALGMAAGMGLAVTAPAHADSSNITWKNARTGCYLTSDTSSMYVWDSCGGSDGQAAGSLWNDIQNSDGSWNEQVASTGHTCLSWAGGSLVNTNNCDARADQTARFMRWYEVPTATGWKLENRDQYYILDDDGNRNVYANASDVGNSDLNQRWH